MLNAAHEQGLFESLPAGVAAILVPCVNASGLAAGRTETTDGIDLNRNFIDFSGSLYRNTAYAKVHDAIMAPDPEVSSGAIAKLIADNGFDAFVTAAHQGQYSHADGLTFGGHATAPEALRVLGLLDEFGEDAERVAVLDIHSGLGGRGLGMLISPTVAVAETALVERIIPLADPVLGYAPPGTLVEAASRRFAEMACLSVVLEFGTAPARDVSSALILSHRRRVLGPAALPSGVHLPSLMREVFAPDDPAWRAKVALRGVQVLQRLIAWLAD